MRNMTFGGFLCRLMYDHRTSLFYRSSQRRSRTEMYSVTGCSNKRASRRCSYCYLHKPYRRSYTSSYPSGSSGSSSSSSYEKSSGSSSSGSSRYKSSSTSGSSSAASRSSSSYSKPKSSYGTSSTEKAQRIPTTTDTMTSIWTGDYDDDRYARDSDYADGVGDALDELGDD